MHSDSYQAEWEAEGVISPPVALAPHFAKTHVAHAAQTLNS